MRHSLVTKVRLVEVDLAVVGAPLAGWSPSSSGRCSGVLRPGEPHRRLHPVRTTRGTPRRTS